MQVSTRPFTASDISTYNHPWRMFETTLERENAGFEKESIKERENAVARLARYGVADMPDDVENALNRLRVARYLCWQYTTRATQKAPGAYVVGPSGYNQRKHERAHRHEGDKYTAITRAERLLDRAIGRHSPNAPVSSDNDNAVELLQAKIDRAEALQARMKTANKIAQSKASTESKTVQLQAMGYSLGAIASMLNPRYSFEKPGHQGWELSNNNANVRRMKERIKELTAKRADVDKEVENESGVRIFDNVTDNRLQIFFPGKPAREVIEQLKRHGFKWSPNAGAWQRFRSFDANYQAEQITGIKLA